MNDYISSYRKNNELIETYFKNWGVMEYKLLNSLMFKFYKSKKKNEIIKNEWVNVPYNELRSLMNISSNKNYKKVIKDALRTIKTTNIVLNHFNGFKSIETSFLYEFGDYEDDYKQIDKNQLVAIKINQKLFESFIEKKAFTVLNIESNKLRGKYTIRLYELIKMKSNQHNPRTKEKNIVKEMYLDELNEFFSTNHKYISLFKQHLEKSKFDLVENEFLNHLHIEYFKDKIHFHFL